MGIGISKPRPYRAITDGFMVDDSGDNRPDRLAFDFLEGLVPQPDSFVLGVEIVDQQSASAARGPNLGRGLDAQRGLWQWRPLVDWR